MLQLVIFSCYLDKMMTIKNNSLDITQIITDYIENKPEKKITFAEYMNLALYHPECGYYSSGNAEIGKQGDFFTSSSLGKDYGELLTEQFFNTWQIMDKTSHFDLVEMGAGLGFLAKDILDFLEQKYPDFFALINYIIIEKSPTLINKQQELLVNYNNKITWKTWENIDSNSLVGCCFSNELVDAFPVHKITIKNEKLQEIYVTVTDSGFTEIIDDISTEKLTEYLKLVGINLPSTDYPEGYQTEVNLAALDWLNLVNDRLKMGYLLTIDYGYTATKYYHPQRYQGTLKCYYQHRHHDNPYINIGCQDITSHVDFTALQNYGKILGLTNIGFTQQAMFLMALGLGDRLDQLRRNTYNFQEVLSRRDALHQLIDPTGLGGFGVLIQGKNVPKNITLKALNFGL
jgi:SAM-dependent MidA family methyltransferase